MNKNLIYTVKIEVPSLGDVLESGASSIFHIEKKGQHFYYYYASVGESVMLVVSCRMTSKVRRYIGFKNGKVIESDFPTSDHPFPVVEVISDPLFETGLEDDKNGKNDM